MAVSTRLSGIQVSPSFRVSRTRSAGTGLGGQPEQAPSGRHPGGDVALGQRHRRQGHRTLRARPAQPGSTRVPRDPTRSRVLGHAWLVAFPCRLRCELGALGLFEGGLLPQRGSWLRLPLGAAGPSRALPGAPGRLLGSLALTQR